MLIFNFRYSEFDELRQRLAAAFPRARNALPSLPPKSVFCTLARVYFIFIPFPPCSLSRARLIKSNVIDGVLVKFRSSFLETRRVGLQHFLKYVA